MWVRIWGRCRTLGLVRGWPALVWGVWDPAFTDLNLAVALTMVTSCALCNPGRTYVSHLLGYEAVTRTERSPKGYKAVT